MNVIEIELKRRSWWARLLRVPTVYRQIRASGTPRGLALCLALHLLKRVR
jgi:hypothetical protein